MCPEIGPPAGLEATRVDVDGEEFVLLEWGAPRAPVRLAALSEAERLVAEAICDGRSHAEIARARGTSPRTVANQVASVYRKLGIGSRLELHALMALGVLPGAGRGA